MLVGKRRIINEDLTEKDWEAIFNSFPQQMVLHFHREIQLLNEIRDNGSVDESSCTYFGAVRQSINRRLREEGIPYVLADISFSQPYQLKRGKCRVFRYMMPEALTAKELETVKLAREILLYRKIILSDGEFPLKEECDNEGREDALH